MKEASCYADCHSRGDPLLGAMGCHHRSACAGGTEAATAMLVTAGLLRRGLYGGGLLRRRLLRRLPIGGRATARAMAGSYGGGWGTPVAYSPSWYGYSGGAYRRRTARQMTSYAPCPVMDSRLLLDAPFTRLGVPGTYPAGTVMPGTMDAGVPGTTTYSSSCADPRLRNPPLSGLPAPVAHTTSIGTPGPFPGVQGTSPAGTIGRGTTVPVHSHPTRCHGSAGSDPSLGPDPALIHGIHDLREASALRCQVPRHERPTAGRRSTPARSPTHRPG